MPKPKVRLTSKLFTFTPETNSYVTEASDITFYGFPPNAGFVIVLENGNELEFEYVGADDDASGEDTLCWNYRSLCKTATAVILND